MEKTGATIVLSSGWRDHPNKVQKMGGRRNVNKQLAKYGLDEVVTQTPHILTQDPLDVHKLSWLLSSDELPDGLEEFAERKLSAKERERFEEMYGQRRDALREEMRNVLETTGKNTIICY